MWWGIESLSTSPVKMLLPREVIGCNGLGSRGSKLSVVSFQLKRAGEAGLIGGSVEVENCRRSEPRQISVNVGIEKGSRWDD